MPLWLPVVMLTNCLSSAYLEHNTYTHNIAHASLIDRTRLFNFHSLLSIHINLEWLSHSYIRVIYVGQYGNNIIFH